MDWLKPFHAIWWALWMELKQPKWMLPILKWVNRRSGDGRYERNWDRGIKISLYGWADGLWDNPKKIYFPLQIAMYEVLHDCDWNFEVKTEGSFVNEPWKISVKAKRCHSRLFNKDTVENNFTYIDFNFEVPEYTLASVYEGAIKELKRIKKVR